MKGFGKKYKLFYVSWCLKSEKMQGREVLAIWKLYHENPYILCPCCLKYAHFIAENVSFLLRITIKYTLFSLKLVSAVFHQIFIFSLNDGTSKTVKNVFFFYLKSSFRSRDIQIFVFFPLPFHFFQIQKDKWKWNN